MTSYVEAAKTCPPEGKEWLIAEQRQLESADETLNRWLDDLWEEQPFPDANASLQEKVALLYRLQLDYDKGNSEQKTSCSFTDLVANALSCTTPREMTVEVSTYHKNSTTPTVIGAASCRNEDVLAEVVFGLLERRGVKHEGVSLESIGSLHVDWRMQREVGQNVHAPVNHGDPKLPRCCVRVLARMPRPEKMTMFVQSLETAREKSRGKCYVLIPKRSSADDEETVGVEKTADNFHVLWSSSLDYSIQRQRVRNHFLFGEGETHYVRQCLKYRNTVAANIRAKLFRQELNYIKYNMSKQGGWEKKLCAMMALTEVGVEHPQWLQHTEYPQKAAELVKDLATYWRTILLQRGDEDLGIDIPAGAPGTPSDDSTLSEDSSSGTSDQSTTGSAEKEASSDVSVPENQTIVNGTKPSGRKKGGRPKGSGKKRGKPAPRPGEACSSSREALHKFLENAAAKYEGLSTPDFTIKFNWKLGHSRNPKGPNALNKKHRKES